MARKQRQHTTTINQPPEDLTLQRVDASADAQKPVEKKLYVVVGCAIQGLDGHKIHREGDRVSLSSVPANVKHLLREVPQGEK